MAKSKTIQGLRFTIEGSHLEARVAFAAVTARGVSYNKALAGSDAGKSSIPGGNACRVHKRRLEQPKVCADCGYGVPMTKENMLKSYDVGEDEPAYLTPEQEASVRPKGGNSVHILHLVTREEVGAWTGSVAPLVPKARCLVPTGEGVEVKKYALMREVIGDDVAVARVMDKTSFYYALLVPDAGGGILTYPLFLPDDAYEVPTAELPVVSEAEATACRKRGAGLLKQWSIGDVSENPFREKHLEAIKAARDGEAISLEEVEVEPVAQDLTALI